MFWRGVLGYLPVNIVQGVVGLLTIVVFTRLLNPEQYGAYALAFSIVAIVYTLSFIWLEASMARFQPAEAKTGKVADHFATLYLTWSLMALAVAAVGTLTVWLVPMSHALQIALMAGFAGAFFKGLAKLAQEHRRAAGRVREAALLDMIMTAAGFGLGAGLAVAGWGGAAPLAGAGAVAALCLVFVLPSELKLAKGGRFDAAKARTYAHYGLPLAASLILGLVLSTTDRLVIGANLDEASVGVYHAGYSLANRTLDVAFIWLGSAAGPAAVAALEFGGMEALKRTAREQSSFMVLITFPAAVGLALVARPLAELLIGPDLRVGAAAVTPWIAMSGLMAGLTTYYFHTAFTLGKATKRLLAAMAFPAAANVALNLFLVPTYGVMGAVWATTISYGLGLIASRALGKTVVDLPIPWDTVLKAGVASAAMAVAVLLIPAFGGVVELIAKAVAGGAVYAVLALALDAGGARGQLMTLVQKVQHKAAAG